MKSKFDAQRFTTTSERSALCCLLSIEIFEAVAVVIENVSIRRYQTMGKLNDWMYWMKQKIKNNFFGSTVDVSAYIVVNDMDHTHTHTHTGNNFIYHRRSSCIQYHSQFTKSLCIYANDKKNNNRNERPQPNDAAKSRYIWNKKSPKNEKEKHIQYFRNVINFALPSNDMEMLIVEVIPFISLCS